MLIAADYDTLRNATLRHEFQQAVIRALLQLPSVVMDDIISVDIFSGSVLAIVVLRPAAAKTVVAAAAKQSMAVNFQGQSLPVMSVVQTEGPDDNDNNSNNNNNGSSSSSSSTGKTVAMVVGVVAVIAVLAVVVVLMVNRNKKQKMNVGDDVGQRGFDSGVDQV